MMEERGACDTARDASRTRFSPNACVQLQRTIRARDGRDAAIDRHAFSTDVNHEAPLVPGNEAGLPVFF